MLWNGVKIPDRITDAVKWSSAPGMPLRSYREKVVRMMKPSRNTCIKRHNPFL